jgi:hypothetical protein
MPTFFDKFVLQSHVRAAQPPVLLLHSGSELGSTLHLHPLQPLQPGNCDPVV